MNGHLDNSAIREEAKDSAIIVPQGLFNNTIISLSMFFERASISRKELSVI